MRLFPNGYAFSSATALLLVVVLCSIPQVNYAQIAQLPPAQRLVALKQLIDTTHNDSLRTDAVYQRGRAFFSSGQPDSAMAAYTQALAMCEHYNLRQTMGMTLLYQSQALHFAGQSDAGLQALARAYTLFEEMYDTQRMSWCLGNMANIYMSKGDYKEAIKEFKKVNYMLLQLGDTVNAAMSWLNIGQIMVDTDQDAAAIAPLDSAIAVLEKLEGYEENTALCYHCKGRALEGLNQQKEALGCYLKALQLARKIEDEYTIGEIYNTLVIYFLKKKEYVSAKKYIDEAFSRLEPLNYQAGISNTWLSLSEWHLEQKQYPEAIQAADKGLQLARSAGININQIQAHDLLATCYKLTGKRKEARQHREEAQALRQPVKDEKAAGSSISN